MLLLHITDVSICEHTSAHVSIRQHTSAPRVLATAQQVYVSIRQHTSAHVSIRQHTSAYFMLQRVLPGRGMEEDPRARASTHKTSCLPLPVYVSIRQHASACVSIRQYTSAYVSIRHHTSAYVSIRAVLFYLGEEAFFARDGHLLRTRVPPRRYLQIYSFLSRLFWRRTAWYIYIHTPGGHVLRKSVSP
jgi:hypothetical protein